MVILRKARVPRTLTLRTSDRSYEQPRKTQKSPFSRLQNTTPMIDLFNNTGRGSMVSEAGGWFRRFCRRPRRSRQHDCPGIPVVEVANSRVSQETLNLFLNAEFHRENRRRIVFRNHNLEIHSCVMDHCIVTQHPWSRRIWILTTTHNMLKLNRRPCFVLS